MMRGSSELQKAWKKPCSSFAKPERGWAQRRQRTAWGAVSYLGLFAWLYDDAIGRII